jgi:alpha-2-macroglobulin
VTVEAVIKNGIAGCEPVEQGDGFKDALVRQLKVKPEGVPVEVVESDFKCIESGSEKFEMARLEVPANVVEDSARAWVYLTGDIMAPALENVGNLVRQPTGCGEQNMVGLVPNIYLLQYLEGTGQREEELETKAKDFMRIGYRRQANYNHPDGSYSIWGGDHNKDGSSWLTAFVVKSFSEAARYIEVDAAVVQRSADWLMKGQMENGCFPKRGYVHSSYLKGGGSDASLTPFIVTALLEAASSKLEIKVDSDRLGEAVDCMWKGLNTSDTYTR